MAKSKTINIDNDAAFSFVKRVAQVGLTLFETDQLNHYFRNRLVIAMRDAKFSDALPQPYIEEINLFFKQALAESADQVLISLMLSGGGLGVFLYELSTTPHGIHCGPAIEFYVPKKSTDRRIPRNFSGIPHLALDVSPTS